MFEERRCLIGEFLGRRQGRRWLLGKKVSIEPRKLGEPIQEKELLFGLWVSNEDEVLKDLSEAGECAPFIGVGYLGLFGLRL